MDMKKQAIIAGRTRKMSLEIDQLANISMLFSGRRAPAITVSLRIGHQLQSRNHIALRAWLVKKSRNDARSSFAWGFSSRRAPCRMRNDPARDSSGESGDGAALRRR